MRGTIPPLPQYAFRTWCLGKAQGQLYLLPFVTISLLLLLLLLLLSVKNILLPCNGYTLPKLLCYLFLMQFRHFGSLTRLSGERLKRTHAQFSPSLTELRVY